MTAISPTRVAVSARPTSLTTGLVLTGAVLAANGALLGSQLLTDARDYSQVAGGNLHLAHYVLWVLCLVALTQLYPMLGGLRGRTGRSVPTPVLALAGAGAALDACARFVSAFVTPYLAERSPALVDSPPDAILLVPLLGTGVLAMAATATLAVVGLRRRVFPRGAAVLLLLGAVAIPVLGPVSNVLLGMALVWIGSAARGVDRS
jgi:hypothetical protein